MNLNFWSQEQISLKSTQASINNQQKIPGKGDKPLPGIFLSSMLQLQRNDV